MNSFFSSSFSHNYLFFKSDQLCFKGEGVAYRGRVLLDLQTVLGERPVKLVEDILHEDILRVQVTDLPPLSQYHITPVCMYIPEVTGFI